MVRTAFGIGKTWLSVSRALRMKTPSLRKSLGFRKGRPTVIAIGGNSFEGSKHATAEKIIATIKAGWLPIITHGNGPQVGKPLRQHPEKTLAECVRITQEQMGKELEQELLKAAAEQKISINVAVIPTRVIVNEDDPAFNNPTKPIGDYYTLDELKSTGTLSKIEGSNLFEFERPGYQTLLIKEIAGQEKPYRQVVASPKPLQIHPEDLEKIKSHMENGDLVIALGGGGVAVSRTPLEDGGVEEKELEAVVDKDLASAVLGRVLQAREFIISSKPKQIALNLGKPNQQDIGYFQAKQLLHKLLEGHFPEGSMGEKTEAKINGVRDGINLVLTTNPESDWIAYEGTITTRGIDVTGRLYNLARMLRLVPNEIQRWLVT